MHEYTLLFYYTLYTIYYIQYNIFNILYIQSILYLVYMSIHYFYISNLLGWLSPEMGSVSP